MPRTLGTAKAAKKVELIFPSLSLACWRALALLVFSVLASGPRKTRRRQRRHAYHVQHFRGTWACSALPSTGARVLLLYVGSWLSACYYAEALHSVDRLEVLCKLAALKRDLEMAWLRGLFGNARAS